MNEHVTNDTFNVLAYSTISLFNMTHSANRRQNASTLRGNLKLMLGWLGLSDSDRLKVQQRSRAEGRRFQIIGASLCGRSPATFYINIGF